MILFEIYVEYSTAGVSAHISAAYLRKISRRISRRGSHLLKRCIIGILDHNRLPRIEPHAIARRAVEPITVALLPLDAVRLRRYSRDIANIASRCRWKGCAGPISGISRVHLRAISRHSSNDFDPGVVRRRRAYRIVHIPRGPPRDLIGESTCLGVCAGRRRFPQGSFRLASHDSPLIRVLRIIACAQLRCAHAMTTACTVSGVMAV